MAESTGWHGLQETVFPPEPPQGSYSDGNRIVVPRNANWGKGFKEGDFKKMCTEASRLQQAGDSAGALEILAAVQRARAHHKSNDWFRKIEAMAAMNMGVVCKGLGQHQRALQQYEHALEIAREDSDMRGTASVLINMGTANMALGRPQDALGHYEEARGLSALLNDPRGEGNVCARIADAHLALDHPQEAVALLEEAVELIRKAHDPKREVALCMKLGDIHANPKQMNNKDIAQGWYLTAANCAMQQGDNEAEQLANKRYEECCEPIGAGQ